MLCRGINVARAPASACVVHAAAPPTRLSKLLPLLDRWQCAARKHTPLSEHANSRERERERVCVCVCVRVRVRQLGVDYVDLVLLHRPCQPAASHEGPSKVCRLCTWQAICNTAHATRFACSCRLRVHQCSRDAFACFCSFPTRWLSRALRSDQCRASCLRPLVGTTRQRSCAHRPPPVAGDGCRRIQPPRTTRCGRAQSRQGAHSAFPTERRARRARAASSHRPVVAGA